MVHQAAAGTASLTPRYSRPGVRVTVLQAGVAEEVGFDSARIERARELIHEQVESGRSPGISAVVARRGKIVLNEAVGARTPDGAPMLADSVFPIASATKPITAAVVMSLVEEGRIGLLQEVRDYIPELPSEVGDGVLIHHLLTHTGGFDSPLWTGKLRELMSSRIFQPLAMTGTAMMVDEVLRTRMITREPNAPLGDEDMERMFGASHETVLDSDSGGGGVVSTPMDTAKFGQMILNGGTYNGNRVLSRASVQAMTTNQIPGVPDVLFGHAEASWGYGFSVICHEPWPYFGGGLVPAGSVTHNGAGGIDHWIDFENEIVGAYFEIITEMSDMMEPISSAGHRFQDVITSAVID